MKNDAFLIGALILVLVFAIVSCKFQQTLAGQILSTQISAEFGARISAKKDLTPNMDVWILTDNKTGCEYVVVRNAVTPLFQTCKVLESIKVQRD